MTTRTSICCIYSICFSVRFGVGVRTLGVGVSPIVGMPGIGERLKAWAESPLWLDGSDEICWLYRMPICEASTCTSAAFFSCTCERSRLPR